MRTETIKIYQFSELSENAKKKAIESLQDVNVYHEWWEYTYEDAKEIGLKITEFDLDRNRHAKGEFILSAAEVAQNILNNHGDTCETYKTTEKFLKDWQPVFDKYMAEDYEDAYEIEEQLLDLENEYLNSLLEDYAMILQKESEYLMSEEAIIETIEANGYEFTAKGEMY